MIPQYYLYLSDDPKHLMVIEKDKLPEKSDMTTIPYLDRGIEAAHYGVALDEAKLKYGLRVGNAIHEKRPDVEYVCFQDSKENDFELFINERELYLLPGGFEVKISHKCQRSYDNGNYCLSPYCYADIVDAFHSCDGEGDKVDCKVATISP